MKEAGCDGVVMGTIIRETIGVIGTAKKLDWNPVFVGTTASYSEIIHKLGGALVNGFYSTCTVNNPYADDPNPKIREWFATYKGKFNEDPTVFSVYGWEIINLFATAAEAAGKDLTPDTLNKAIEFDQVPGRHVRRRRANVLGDQAPRHRPRDAVPDPGRQVEVGVGVFDELKFDPPALKQTPLIPAQAGIQGQELGPRFRGDERRWPIPHHIRRAAGRDQLAFIVHQLHVRDRDAVAEPHHAPGGDEVFAASGPQIIDMQVDRADRREACVG